MISNSILHIRRPLKVGGEISRDIAALPETFRLDSGVQIL